MLQGRIRLEAHFGYERDEPFFFSQRIERWIDLEVNQEAFLFVRFLQPSHCHFVIAKCRMNYCSPIADDMLIARQSIEVLQDLLSSINLSGTRIDVAKIV